MLSTNSGRRGKHTFSARAAAAVAVVGLALSTVSLSGQASAQEEETSAKPAAGPAVDKTKATDSPAETRKFWTQKRVGKALVSAKKDPMHNAPSAAEVTRKANEAARDQGLTASTDAVRPEGKATIGSRHTAGSVSKRVPHADSWPTVAVGRVVAQKPNGDLSVCSGASINSKTKNAVWTAGHCVHPGDGSGVKGFYKKIAFVPAAKDKDQPYGTWSYKTAYAPQDWTRGDEGDDDTADMAAFVVAPDPKFGDLEKNVGAFGYDFGSGPDHDGVHDYGYPAEGYNRPDSDFNDGKYMMYCSGKTEDAANNWPWDDRLKMDCDMGKGASGGPMVTGAPDDTIRIVGANSHYEAKDNKRVDDNLFSSEHGDNAVQLIKDVDADA